MKVKTDTYTVGVIIGRFQLPALHEAHTDLIRTVIQTHPRVLILLGISPVRGSITDPLDFQTRKQMLLDSFPPSEYPNLDVAYVKDQHSDELWSASVDSVISNFALPTESVVLYGSRDSFLPHYHGKHPTLELVSERVVSASEIRGKIAQAPQNHPMFRMGAIWATFQRFPTVYSTVDVIPYRLEKEKAVSILLGKKAGEKKYRFIGGFVDVEDSSIEHAAGRELREEAGLAPGLSQFRYLGSSKVDDWRYRKSKSEKIMTHLYAVRAPDDQNPQAGDDIAEVRWFKVALDSEALRTFFTETLVPEHGPIGTNFTTKFIETTVIYG